MKARHDNLLVTAADGNYLHQAKQLFSSVYFKAGWQGDCLLLTTDISASDREWFESRGIIVFSPPLLTANLLGDKNYPPIILSKFYLFSEEFRQWQKILFIDADIIVRHPLSRLVKRSGFNAPPAIGLDDLSAEFFSLPIPDASFSRSVRASALPFTTGVFLFEPAKIPPQALEEMLALYRRFSSLARFGEESIMNLYFYQRWRRLPLVYNALPYYMQLIYGIAPEQLDVPIIHFCCDRKPWQPESFFYQEWQDNLNRADEIDFSKDNRPEAADYQGDCPSNLWYLNFIKYRLAFLQSFHRQGGKAGRFIKRLSPKLYAGIKKYCLGSKK